jgi:mediator of RNA polymerase II transcription subunit 5
VKPNSISGEAKAIHQTVLNITARPLEEQLKNVRTRNQSRTDIKPILDALEPYLSFRRVGSSHRTELDTWTSHAAGGLVGSIRSTLQALILWSSNPEISAAPHTYTHRQILAGIRILGATRVLAAIIDEVKHQSETTGSGHVALDIATTIICAPMTESFAVDQNNYHPIDPMKESPPRCPILTLRDALTLAHENVPKLSEKDPLRAEVVVRLWRRVNLLMAPPSQVSNIDVSNIIQNMHLGVEGHDRMDMEPSAADVAGNTVGEDDPDNINQMLDKAAAAAAAAGMDGGIGVAQDMELDAGGAGLDAIDDVLNAADMAVGNPEFLDLDMEGMF